MGRGAVGAPGAGAAEGRDGFPTSARATPVPNLFFSRDLAAIDSAEELLVTLYFFYAQGRSHRSPAFVSRRELAAEGALATALANFGAEDTRTGGGLPGLDRGLALAVERGSLLRVAARGDGRDEELYLLATPHNRRAAGRLAGAALRLDEPLPEAEPAEPENIFALYEQNVGAITPLIAEELKDAEERYPPHWVERAFREAVSLNKRSWRYIHSILRRWEAEGLDDEEAGRDPEADWLERRYSRGKRGPRR